MSLPTFLTDTADAQVEEIDLWWRDKRPAAPDLFAQELAEALNLISALPGVGQVYRSGGKQTIRRVLMRATRHHVYYAVETHRVIVMAVWGAVRGAGPAASMGAAATQHWAVSDPDSPVPSPRSGPQGRRVPSAS
jgi:plasmid stabilization system protein ParE